MIYGALPLFLAIYDEQLGDISDGISLVKIAELNDNYERYDEVHSAIVSQVVDEAGFAEPLSVGGGNSYSHISDSISLGFQGHHPN
jgi:hypothetical protein